MLKITVEVKVKKKDGRGNNSFKKYIETGYIRLQEKKKVKEAKKK